MKPPRVLVLYNEPGLPPEHPDFASEQDVLYSVKIVCESLAAQKLTAERLGVGPDPAVLIAGLRQHAPDVVFNLFEGTAEHGTTEATVAGILEWLRLPYTGCPPQAMTIARNKPLAKQLFAGGGVRTPEFVVVDGPCPPNRLGWPVIVKPATEDASVGIEQVAVVTSDTQLRDRVDYVLHRYGGPVLIEQFVIGREMHVTLADLDGAGEPTALPFAEIRFEPAEDLWPIYSYTAKWDEASREYALRPVDVPVILPPGPTEALIAASRQAFRLLGCRDLARVDTRLTPDGEVYVLEVNPNPSITSIMLDTGLTAMGRTYDGFIAHLARTAAARGGLAGVNPYGRADCA